MQKIAAITGASGGLGSALYKSLTLKGYTVYSLSLDNPEDFSNFVYCDVTTEETVMAAFKEISNSGGIDLLIVNAGIGVMGATEDLPSPTIERVIDVNYTGAMYTLKHGAKALNKSGRILVTASASGLFPLPYRGLYCATKSALHISALSMDLEMRKNGKRVVSVCPGEINTRFVENRITHCGGEHSENVENLKKEFIEKRNTRMSADFAAKQYLKIADKKNPKPFYIIGGKYKFFYLMSKILPCRLFHKLIMKKYGGSK